MGLDIAINGVWGNMGVGFAAFITGLMIDQTDGVLLSGCPASFPFALGCFTFFIRKTEYLSDLQS